MSEILVPFLYELRARKLRVGPTEMRSLAQALESGLHESTLDGFYYVARALLVHSETELDAFDEAFGAFFRGIEGTRFVLTREIEAWLKDPAMLEHLTPEQMAMMESLDIEELRRMFQERLAEQRERHEGGNRWVGTGGTSPFGAGGKHETGLRVGPQGLSLIHI